MKFTRTKRSRETILADCRKQRGCSTYNYAPKPSPATYTFRSDYDNPYGQKINGRQSDDFFMDDIQENIELNNNLQYETKNVLENPMNVNLPNLPQNISNQANEILKEANEIVQADPNKKQEIDNAINELNNAKQDVAKNIQEQAEIQQESEKKIAEIANEKIINLTALNKDTIVDQLNRIVADMDTQRPQNFETNAEQTEWENAQAALKRYLGRKNHTDQPAYLKEAFISINKLFVKYNII